MRRPYALALLLLPGIIGLPALASAQLQFPPIYPVYRYAAPESDLRFSVKPKEAEVYVDGYFAGKVEDFDGALQRLHVTPGEHEVVVYLDGYKSLRQKLYLSPRATRKIEGTLEKLGPGDVREAAPQPSPESERGREDVDRMPPNPGRGMPRIPAPPRDIPERPQPVPQSRFGTLSIRIQPSGATVFIDGERWTGPASNDERLIVQVPEGRHRVEVEHEGYERFVTETDVKRTETTPVNVSLTRIK